LPEISELDAMGYFKVFRVQDIAGFQVPVNNKNEPKKQSRTFSSSGRFHILLLRDVFTPLLKKKERKVRIMENYSASSGCFHEKKKGHGFNEGVAVILIISDFSKA
jgi:hypothetical protein